MIIASSNRLIAKLGTSRQTKRHGVGMPSTSRSTENVNAVEAHVLSNEDSHITIPRISRETDIS